jgi:hypothetical protein
MGGPALIVLNTSVDALVSYGSFLFRQWEEIQRSDGLER